MTPRFAIRSLRRSASGYKGRPVTQSLMMRWSRSRSSSSIIVGDTRASARPFDARVARAPDLTPPTGTSSLSAHERPHLVPQVARPEGLADEVRPAHLHGGDAVPHIGVAGEEEYGDLAGLRLAAEDLAQLPSVQARHAHVEQHQRGRLRQRLAQCLHRVAEPVHLVAFAIEGAGDGG